MLDAHAGFADFLDEIGLDQTDDFLLLLVAHAIGEHRPILADEHIDDEAPLPGGQRQAVGSASTMSGGHEDGRRLAPQAQFERPVEHQVRLLRLHGHHQAGRAAGEFQRLGVVGNKRVVSRKMRRQRLFHAHRVDMILVIIGIGRKGAVAGFFVEREGARVVPAHFQPHHHEALFQGDLFRLGQQRAGDAAALSVGQHREGIEARHRRVAVEQHQAVAGDGAVCVIDDKRRVPARQKVAEVARRQPVGVEALLFQIREDRDIFQGGVADHGGTCTTFKGRINQRRAGPGPAAFRARYYARTGTPKVGFWL